MHTGTKSSLRREPNGPGDLLRALFGNVTEPSTGQIPAYALGNEPSMPRVGLGFEPDADDEDEDHLIESLIAHVYKTLGSIALRPHESNLGGTQQLHPVFRVAFLDH
jgi:hypothetical protein